MKSVATLGAPCHYLTLYKTKYLSVIKLRRLINAQALPGLVRITKSPANQNEKEQGYHDNVQ